MYQWYLPVSMSRKEVSFMSKQFEYKSAFAPYFDSFLKMKDTMGYGLNKFRWTFLELDRFFLETGVTDTYITSEQIAAWSKTRVNDKARTLYDKYSVLSQFCRCAILVRNVTYHGCPGKRIWALYHMSSPMNRWKASSVNVTDWPCRLPI